MSIDVNALQLLPEIHHASGLQSMDGIGLIRTCYPPTCIITYCSVPDTTIG